MNTETWSYTSHFWKVLASLMVSGFHGFGKGWFWILWTFRGLCICSLLSTKYFYCSCTYLASLTSEYFSLNPRLANSVRCRPVPGLLNWKLRLWKEPEITVLQLEGKSPSPTPSKTRTPVNNQEVNVSSHSFSGSGLSEAGAWVRGDGFIFENRNLESVVFF